MDGIIDTVSAFHPILPLISLLKVHGKMIMLGGPNKPLELYSYSLIQGKYQTRTLLLGVYLGSEFANSD